MSADDQGGAGRREVAYRVFSAEFEDADFSYSESDEERAPNYVVTPTGARVNRLFVVGVLTEVEPAGEDILRARVVDPTGAFVVYAGQYQPDAQAFFERAEPPAFVAVTGKARTFQPEDGDVTYTSVRPENVNEVTAETRDRWNVQAARQTLDRVATMARALRRDERGDDLRRALEADGVDVGLAAGIPLALDHYGTTGAYLDAVRDLAIRAAELVAGERDEVESLSVDPDAPGQADLDALATIELPPAVGGSVESSPGGSDAGTTGATGDATADTEPTGDEEESTAETESEPTADAEGHSADSTAESGVETSSESAGVTDAVESSDPATDERDTPGTAEEVGDFDPGEFELDDEEREAIEEEYGTEFTTGTEVDEPGSADIETPEPAAESGSGSGSPVEQTAETTDEQAAASTVESGEVDEAGEATAPGADESPSAEATGSNEAPSAEAGEADEPAEDVDLEEAVMDAMRALDDGDGAAESDIVERVSDRTGEPADAVTEAIQDALMGGQCYEPEDGVYKPI
ncbi:MAG: hypothetical protein ABEJ40_11245 [Haloarculaceae archaeon]